MILYQESFWDKLLYIPGFSFTYDGKKFYHNPRIVNLEDISIKQYHENYPNKVYLIEITLYQYEKMTDNYGFVTYGNKAYTFNFEIELSKYKEITAYRIAKGFLKEGDTDYENFKKNNFQRFTEIIKDLK